MTTGTVTIDIEPCPSQEFCEAARKLCIGIIASGAVGMKNGHVTIHFDAFGNTVMVETHKISRNIYGKQNANIHSPVPKVEHQL